MLRTRGRTIVGLLLALGAVAAAPAHAADRIYWTGSSGEVSSADPSGEGSPTTLYPGRSGQRGTNVGIDIDVTRNQLVWSAGFDLAIHSAPLDGSGPVRELATTSNEAYGPQGVAVDQAGGRALWLVNQELDAVPLEGGATKTLYACCVTNPAPDYRSNVLAVDDVNGRVYFNGETGVSAIYSAPLDGSGPVQQLYELGPQYTVHVGGLAVDPVRGFIYWASETEVNGREWVSKIERAPLDGSGPSKVIYADEPFPAGLAVDAAEGYLYWGLYYHNAIRKAPLDGSGPVQTIASTESPQRVTLLRTPWNTGAPALTGLPVVGSKITCSNGSWAEDIHGSYVHRPPATGFAYRWQRNGVDIDGAHAATYRPSSPGNYTCAVTATNIAGSSEATSATLAVVERPRVTPGRAFLGRSGSIFVPIRCVNPFTGRCDTTLKIVFKKPRHGFRTITRRLHVSAGTSRVRIALSRTQRRKLLRIRRQRVTVTLTNPSGGRVRRNSTLIGIR